MASLLNSVERVDVSVNRFNGQVPGALLRVFSDEIDEKVLHDFVLVLCGGADHLLDGLERHRVEPD